MTCRTAKVVWGLILTAVASVSYGQQKAGVNSNLVRPLIMHILLKGHVSGSLEYSGSCELQRPQPDIPKVRILLRSCDSCLRR